MTRFQAIPGVEDVHDLHIWSISSDSISLTCHIRVMLDPCLFPPLFFLHCSTYVRHIYAYFVSFYLQAQKPQEVLLAAHKICRKLGIDHATIQVHDAADKRFCYSETCDDGGGDLLLGVGACTGPGGEEQKRTSNGGAKKKACV